MEAAKAPSSKCLGFDLKTIRQWGSQLLSTCTTIRNSCDGDRVYSAGQVTEILASRAVIGQGNGVLMFVYDVDVDEAFDMLRSQARRTNVKVRDLVDQILAKPTLVEETWDYTPKTSGWGLFGRARGADPHRDVPLMYRLRSSG